MKLDLWLATDSSTLNAAATAKRVEAAGWDGLAIYDSQNLDGDCYVALALAAAALNESASVPESPIPERVTRRLPPVGLPAFSSCRADAQCSVSAGAIRPWPSSVAHRYG